MSVGARSPVGLPDLQRLTNQSGAPWRHGSPDRDSLVHQCRDGHAPAFAHSPQSSRIGNTHLVEEALVELGLTGHLKQRSYIDAGGVHVHEERRDALVFRNIGVGARNDETIGSNVRESGPHLLTRHNPLITVTFGASRQRRDVRSGTWLGEQLTPDFLTGEQGTQKARLLLVGAVGRDRGGHHAVANDVAHDRARRPQPGQPAHGVELVGRREAEPSVSFGKVHPGQAAVELLTKEFDGIS